MTNLNSSAQLDDPRDDDDDTALPGESKADRFKRLGTARLNRAVKAIRLLGNLSNRSNYEYSEAQIAAIHSALEKETAAVVEKFGPVKERGPSYEL